jgi:KUP system potassium uptake protein
MQAGMRRELDRAQRVPITLVILVGLFFVQRRGAAFIGKIFGPVMLVWFLVPESTEIAGVIAPSP